MISVSSLAVAAGHAACAQTAAPAAATPAAPADANSSVQEIVVTGTAGGGGVKKLDAGYAITTLTPKALAQLGAKTTGEILTAVPGIWVESSGGQGTSNIFVRGIPSTGDAPFVTVQVNGVSVFGMNSPSFMDQTALFRADETISNVEAVNGGPASVFSDGQPGLTTNFTLKQGHDQTEGELKVTGSTYGQRRIDGELSGKLADDLYYMIGGYVTDGPSVRDAGFDTERGAQFTANITKDFERGKLNLFARYTDDHGEWYVPFATGVPGLNLGTYNPLNGYTRFDTIQTGSGSKTVDLGDGRGWKGVVAGGNLNYDLGDGFQFRDTFGVTEGDLNTYALVGAGNAVTVGQVLAANPGLGSVTTVDTHQTLGSNAYLAQYGSWMALKHLHNVSNELNFEKTIFNNKITAGYYFARFSSDDNWSLGNPRTMQIGGSDDLVNVTADQMLAAGNGGNGAGPFFTLRDSGTGDINAFYLADSFNVTDNLRIDAAVRDEDQKIHFSEIGNGTPGFAVVDRSRQSWTAGVNYKLNPNMDVYVRLSEGAHFPSFDDVRSEIGNTGASLDKTWTIYSDEGGFKFHNRSFDADVTAFFDKAVGVVYNDVGVAPVIAGSDTYGVEFDGRWTSDFGLSVTTNDTIENPISNDPIDKLIDGKQAERIPKYQVRISPAYKFDLPDDITANIYGTFMAIGSRFSDLQNTQDLPAYQTINAGIIVNYRAVTFQLAGDNLTDSHGLTEGNPRTIGTGANATLPLSRPIFGRSATFSVAWKF
jgi:outer membrane cobalamin receptor